MTALAISLGIFGLARRGHAREPAAGPQSSVPFYQSADFTAEWIPPTDPAYPAIHRVGPFSLTNQEGETITNETLRGKVYVATFFFSHCTSLCPKMLANLRALQRALHDQPRFAIVSHSVMPSVDSQQVLRAYAHKNGIERGRWHLLTGDHDAIYGLARRSYFAEKRAGLDKKPNELLHTENMVLVDQRGRLRGVYNATLRAEVERAEADVRALLAEP